MTSKRRRAATAGLVIGLAMLLFIILGMWTGSGFDPEKPGSELAEWSADQDSLLDDGPAVDPEKQESTDDTRMVTPTVHQRDSNIQKVREPHAYGARTRTDISQYSQDFHNLVLDSKHPDWDVRWDAVNELGKSKDPRAISALVERTLYDENSHPRWRSLWALKAIGAKGSRAIPMLRNALLDPDPVVARNAAIGLAFFGQPDARAELLKGLDDPNSFRRWEAIYSLRVIGAPEVARELAVLLGSQVEPEVSVRGEAALALGYMGIPAEVMPPLVHALRTDESPQVRWRAALALSKVSHPSLVEPLEEAMRSELDPNVREQLAVALTKARRTN